MLRATHNGFQIVEVIVATSILVVVVGGVIALSVASSRTLEKSADVLFAISLAQLTMDKVLGSSYDQINDDAQTYSLYEKDKELGIFNPLEEFRTQDTSDFSDQLPQSLAKQITELNVRYQVRVAEVYPPNAFAIKQVLVTVFWNNSGNTLEYKLSGYLSKKYDD